MAKVEPVNAESVMESRKRKGYGVPLPYLIRPRRIMPPIDTFGFYNDYLSDDESDDDKSAVEAMVTSVLNKGNSFGIGNEDVSMKDEKDEEYVIVNKVEALPDCKPEKPGTIQMMELSKGTVDDESVADDAGSNSGDEWVVV